MTVRELVRVATTMVNAYVKAGRVKPVLPKRYRRKVVSALSLAVTNFFAYEIYLAALKAKLKDNGIGNLEFQQLWGLEDEVVNRGFAVLSNDDLACFALSPDALSLIQSLFLYGETEAGQWFVESLMENASWERDLSDKDRTIARSLFPHESELTATSICFEFPGVRTAVSGRDNGGPPRLKAALASKLRFLGRLLALKHPPAPSSSRGEFRSGPFFKEDKYHLKKEDI